ncbi:hypothetical protein ASZ78_006847 [Callipepla squamata]|uniref:B30.2/SPRY domain-containing protein n=1 Tax=Callipepla squamata TaxID=9009 RepID=A0A226MDH1_CALSU|nr:hypothetical protein ASZ78_006847 [Callipepla squamata]
MSWVPAFSSAPEHATQHKSRVDSHNRNQERLSKSNKGEGIPESREGGPETQIQFPCVKDVMKNFESPDSTDESDKPPQKESRVDTPKRVLGKFSKQSKGNADPEIEKRVTQTQIPSFKDVKKYFESPVFTSKIDKPPKKESRVDSTKRVQENFSKQNKGRTDDTNTLVDRESMQEEVEKILNEKLVAYQRQLERTQHANPPMEELIKTQMSLQKISENVQALQTAMENMQVPTKKDLEVLRAVLEGKETKGRAVDTNTLRGRESMREELEKILSEKLDVLQRQLEMTQHANPPMEEMTNTQMSLKKISENVQALQKALENVFTKKDLEILRAIMEGKETKALTNESEKPPQKESSVDSHKIVQEKFSNQSKGNADALTLERVNIGLRVSSMDCVLPYLRTSHLDKLIYCLLYFPIDFLKVQRYKVDVTLNPDTAHPRLKVSKDGKSVKDTGEIRQVPSTEERFDSNIFVLAKEGYTSGKHYWEVDVGKRRNWILGVASESVARKGTLTLSPKNGFWVIGFADGQEYWAHTEPWTRLTVGGRPQKIGIFLDISANKLSFYNVNKKKDLHTFTTIGDSRQGRKFVPFFSTSSGGVSVCDTEPLNIVPGFDDDD